MAREPYRLGNMHPGDTRCTASKFPCLVQCNYVLRLDCVEDTIPRHTIVNIYSHCVTISRICATCLLYSYCRAIHDEHGRGHCCALGGFLAGFSAKTTRRHIRNAELGMYLPRPDRGRSRRTRLQYTGRARAPRRTQPPACQQSV